MDTVHCICWLKDIVHSYEICYTIRADAPFFLRRIYIELPETRCETKRCSGYTLVTELVVIMTDLRLANKSPLSPYDSCLHSSVGFTCTWPEASRNSFPWWFRPCLDFIYFPLPSLCVSIINHFLQRGSSLGTSILFLKTFYLFTVSPGRYTEVQFHFALKGRVCKGQQPAVILNWERHSYGTDMANFSLQCVLILLVTRSNPTMAALYLASFIALKGRWSAGSYGCYAAAVWKTFLFLPSLLPPFSFFVSPMSSSEWMHAGGCFLFHEDKTGEGRKEGKNMGDGGEV